MIPIISRYARKVLFSGVFYNGSIFQDGGMVMDEAGRNGWKWRLAQQIVQPVIRYVLSSTTNHTPCNHAHSVDNNKPHIMQLSITIFQQQITYHVTLYIFQQFTHHVIALSHRYGGIFISLISIKKFPSYPIIIIYNLLTNRWLEYGII